MDIDTVRARLDEARSAQHRLMTGTQVVAVVIDGVSTSFSRPDDVRLAAYIASLESQELRLACGRSAVARRPIGLI
jgi:hypothetical protein